MDKHPLQLKYPELFPDGYCEVSISDGWVPLVGKLCAQLQRLTHRYKFKLQIVQIKEKFGGLRFYYDISEAGEGVTPIVVELVILAEEIASIVCEFCGKPGKLRYGSWWTTLCDECYERRTRDIPNYEVQKDTGSEKEDNL